MSNIVELLREDEAQLRKMVGQAGLAGQDTSVRVMNPAFLIANLSTAANEIESLRSRAEKAEAEVARLKSERLYVIGFNDGFDEAKEEAKEQAEATCEKLAKALDRIVMGAKRVDLQGNGAHTDLVMPYLINEARSALSEYRKEASKP